MRRYLTLDEAQAALNRGKQIEQFLGGYLANGESAIRYTVIRKDRERLVANTYECLEPTDIGFYDLVEFANVEPDSDPEDFYFDTLGEAISFLEYNNGADPDRFVNQGLASEEYKAYRLAKTQSAS